MAEGNPGGRSLPPPSAHSSYARTIYRELMRSGHSRAEILTVVNELLDQILSSPEDAPLSGVTDLETALANHETLIEALDAAVRRAQHAGLPSLIVLVDVKLPEWAHDDVVVAFHAHVAGQLRRGVRPSDTVARLSTARYALLLTGAGRTESAEIARRLLEPLLAPRPGETRAPSGTVIEWRAASTPLASRFDAGALLEEVAALAPSNVTEDGRGGAAPVVRVMDTEHPPSRRLTIEDNIILVLGGGAARAAAHIGVLDVLERAKIRVVGIAGTSAGAIVGAMYLQSRAPGEILERFVAFSTSSLYKRMRRAYAAFLRTANIDRSQAKLYRSSGTTLLSSHALSAFDDELFEEFVSFFTGPDQGFASLRAPFTAVATDLVAGRPVWMTRGPLHLALRASTSVPGLFRPQREGDRVLVDGAVVSEVPIGAARCLGLDVPVLAVYLARPERSVDAFRASSDVIARAHAMAHKELVREQLDHANLVMTAQVMDIGWLDFARAPETMRVGTEAATMYLRSLGREIKSQP